MNWDLSKLYKGFDDPAFIKDFQNTADETAALRSMLDTLTVETLPAFVARLRDVTDVLGILNNMVFLTLAADSNCEAALEPRMRLLNLMNEYKLLISAFTLWVSRIEDMDAVCESDPLLKEHRLFFRMLREEAAHMIDPALEPTVLKMQMSGGSSWMRLRDELFSSLSIDVTIDGETKKLPLPAVRAMACDPRSEVRKTAYEAEIAAYPRMETGMAACLNGIKGEALTMAELQHYDSILDWALAGARMERATLDALMLAMKESLPMFRRYFRLKNRLLGNEGALKFYDLFAPVGKNTKRYTLEESKAVLLKVFGEAHAPIAEIMRRAYEENWIDAYPREGKEGGAFCSGVHGLKMSYVLTNFDGSFSDVSTLAHELGHAYHDFRISEVSSLLTDIPMPLAETASTFNELVLSEESLKNADPETAAALLDTQLTDAAQVIVDIMSRYLFESEVIERRKSSTLSARELCRIMLDAQKQTYGDGLDPEYLHPYMWACKSHYYDTVYHFYNFPYAFGLLFGAGLYALRQERGEAFWPLYDSLLTFSGAGTIREVAATAGIDVNDPEFWRGSLKLFERKLEQLESLSESL